MEIILKEDVTNLGYKDDIVKVKNGYANNYLIPQGMAVIATPTNRKIHAENLKQQAEKIAAARKNAEAQQLLLDGKAIVINAKVGETGKIYGSITNADVAAALKEQHDLDIDSKQVTIEGVKIKEVGTYKAVVKIFRDVKAEISLTVKDENAKTVEEENEQAGKEE